MEPKKVQKQGRDERTQEDYPTSGVYFCRCRVVFLRSFISALFLYFFWLHPYFKSSFTETFFPSTFDRWHRCLERGNEVCAVLLDLKNAFDRVPHAHCWIS